jgi:hypothetical protein
MQAQLHDALLEHGIDTHCVDRYVVAQSKQAVAVAHPVSLVQQLESLTSAPYDACLKHACFFETPHCDPTMCFCTPDQAATAKQQAGIMTYATGVTALYNATTHNT